MKCYEHNVTTSITRVFRSVLVYAKFRSSDRYRTRLKYNGLEKSAKSCLREMTPNEPVITPTCINQTGRKFVRGKVCE